MDQAERLPPPARFERLAQLCHDVATPQPGNARTGAQDDVQRVAGQVFRPCPVRHEPQRALRLAACAFPASAPGGQFESTLWSHFGRIGRAFEEAPRAPSRKEQTAIDLLPRSAFRVQVFWEPNGFTKRRPSTSGREARSSPTYSLHPAATALDQLSASHHEIWWRAR